MPPTDDLDRFEPVPDPRPNDEAWPQLSWPIPAGTELSGAAVRLTPVDPVSDAPELFRQLDHDIVWAHLPFRPTTLVEMTRMLMGWRENPEWHAWTVRLLQDIGDLPAGSVVGTTSYLDVSVCDARLEIGATIYAPAVWSTSVNPEAKRLLLEYAFETLHAGRVQLKTDTRNHRSQQAIARLGAQYEGTLRRNKRRADGTVRDDVMFSITTEDWPAVNERLSARLDVPQAPD